MHPSRTSRMLLERERLSDERKRQAASRGILTVWMLGQPTQLRIWSARTDSAISPTSIGKRIWFGLSPFSGLTWRAPAGLCVCNPNIGSSELLTARLKRLHFDSGEMESSVELKLQTPSFISSVPRFSSHMISCIISEERMEPGDVISIGLCWSITTSSIPMSSDVPRGIGGQARWLHR